MFTFSTNDVILDCFAGNGGRASWLFYLLSLSLSLHLQYLSAIEAGSSPLLHIRTFLLGRLSHLNFLLERAWSVSELCINTLHCMAREINLLKVGRSCDAM